MGKVKGYAGLADKNIKVNAMHIVGMELKDKSKNRIGMGGFHLDKNFAVEKSGIFDFINKEIHDHGFYAADIYYKGNKLKRSSFFPADWSCEKVIEKIFEAFEYCKLNGVMPEQQTSGKLLLRGCISEGTRIEMFVSQAGEILTAYPIFKK